MYPNPEGVGVSVGSRSRVFQSSPTRSPTYRPRVRSRSVPPTKEDDRVGPSNDKDRSRGSVGKGTFGSLRFSTLNLQKVRKPDN